MGAIVGIDLGTCFSALAVFDAKGEPRIVPNAEGQHITPSIVTLDGPTNIVVGQVARRTWNTNSSAAAARFKRIMGESKTCTIGDREFTPTELSAFVLKKLIKDAEVQIGPISQAVVTIPANFPNEARDATMAAAKAAGLDIEYIINEPTAAALYYAFKNSGELHGSYAVYDLGGGTFDVSIIRVDGQDVEVLASCGVRNLGGDDFDAALVELVRAKFRAMTGRDADPRRYGKGDAEEDKKSLSQRKNVAIDLDGSVLSVSREEFEQSISIFVAKAQLSCESALEDAKLGPSDIKEVFLAGGSTRIPSVQASVERVFGRKPTSTLNVDEIVALGAALYAGYRAKRTSLSPSQRESVRTLAVAERTAKCFGTFCLDPDAEGGEPRDINKTIIQRGTEIPCNKTESFYTVVHGQTQVNCELTESDEEETDPQFVRIVRSEPLDLPPNRPAGQRIDVTYTYDANQRIQCSYVDVATGNRTVFEESFAAEVTETLAGIEGYEVE